MGSNPITATWIFQVSKKLSSKVLTSLLIIGSLSSRVFETRTTTGSGLFPPLTCLHTAIFTLLNIVSLLEMIRVKFWETPLSWHAKWILFRLPSASQKRACLSSLISSKWMPSLNVILRVGYQNWVCNSGRERKYSVQSILPLQSLRRKADKLAKKIRMKCFFFIEWDWLCLILGYSFQAPAKTTIWSLWRPTFWGQRIFTVSKTSPVVRREIRWQRYVNRSDLFHFLKTLKWIFGFNSLKNISKYRLRHWYDPFTPIHVITMMSRAYASSFPGFVSPQDEIHVLQYVHMCTLYLERIPVFFFFSKNFLQIQVFYERLSYQEVEEKLSYKVLWNEYIFNLLLKCLN